MSETSAPSGPRGVVAGLANLRNQRPKVESSDLVAGLTNGIASIPDGMASAVIAGVNPVYGLYTLMVGTPIAALTTSTALMVFSTTSAMTLVAADGLGNLAGDEGQALMAIAVMAGAFQLMLGLLGLGTLTKFVSNAVMTGLLTGVAALIILGQLWDFFGYSGTGDNKIEQAADLLRHLNQIDIQTTLIGLLSIGLMIGLERTRLRSFNLLIALLAATLVTSLLGSESVALVRSLGEIPRSLPSLSIPSLDLLLNMALAGIAVGVVGLLQAAGVAQRYPNRDGSEPDDSRDFVAQGVANVACGFFQGMPGGGSLSSTALGAGAGARTRWAGFFIGVVVIVFVLLFGGFLELIPMTSLGALLIYSAALSVKIPLIVAVQKTGLRSHFAMLATFALTLLMPLQQAIILGVIVAGVLYIYRSSTDIRIVRLDQVDGRFVESEAPETVPDNQVLLLDVYGSLFYAGARTLASNLPSATDAQNAVVVLRLRSQGEVGSTLLNVLNTYAGRLQKGGGLLMLTGIDPEIKARMTAANQLATIGPDNVFVATHIRHQSIDAALAAARQWQLAQAEPEKV